LPLGIRSQYGDSSNLASGSSGGHTGELLIITLLDTSLPCFVLLWLVAYSGRLGLEGQLSSAYSG
jgi:hypothetical protein